jgi:CDP-diacylglycerol--glycerol-3-phosphate 3-phosphatidyltransferase
LGFHANTVTILGFVLTVGVALLLAKGDLTLGGWLLLLVVPIDAIDGALARLLGQKSTFGAFLDSTLDRVSEIALFSGLIFYYLSQGANTELILAVVSMMGGVMVSYTRARAEALGYCCKVGILTRLERAVVLLAGLVLGYTKVALWVLAIGSWVTALHRILHVYTQSRRAEQTQ